jgi:hypothetical protein
MSQTPCLVWPILPLAYPTSTCPCFLAKCLDFAQEVMCSEKYPPSKGHQKLTSVTIATWEIEIRRIMAWGQPGKIVCKTPVSKITRAKWAGGVAQAVENPFASTQPWVQTAVSQKKKAYLGVAMTQWEWCKKLSTPRGCWGNFCYLNKKKKNSDSFVVILFFFPPWSA